MSREEPSKATLLVNLVIDAKIPLFHTPEQETYAELSVDGHYEIWPLRSQQFQYWMDRQYFRAYREGAGKHALQDALLTLHAHALYDGRQRNVYLRMAEEKGVIYLDLCDAEWRVVRISQTGWELGPIGITDGQVRSRHTTVHASPSPDRMLRRRGIEITPQPTYLT